MKPLWTETLKSFFNRKVVSMLFLGFSAGLPILLIFSTLSVRLAEANISRTTIGFFSWAALGYAFKFIWAPLIDRCPLPLIGTLLGRRRSWLLLSQILIILAIIFMGLTNPVTELQQMALWAVVLGFSSATQDIVIDAYRIEAAHSQLQGLLSSSYIAGYRVGMLVAGAGALELAGFFDAETENTLQSWTKTYLIMACFMLIGVVTTCIIDEPINSLNEKNSHLTSDYLRLLMVFIIGVSVFIGLFFHSSTLSIGIRSLVSELGWLNQLALFFAESLRLIGSLIGAAFIVWVAIKLGLAPPKIVFGTYLAPIKDFFSRYGKVAIAILLLIATYRISDVVMGVIANVFYIDIGFEKQDIGRISKGFGLIMTIFGGFLGGLLIVRFGILPILLLGGILAALTNLLFVLFEIVGNAIWMLMVVISADNLSAGVAAAAFVAYLSSLTNKTFTATQYALFSSLMLLLPKLIAGYSGMVVDAIGYSPFFVMTAILGIPVLVIIVFVARHNNNL